MKNDIVPLSTIEPYASDLLAVWGAALVILIVADIAARYASSTKPKRAIRFIGGLASLAVMALPLVGAVMLAMASVRSGEVIWGMIGFITLPLAAVFVAGTVKKLCVWAARKLIGPEPGQIEPVDPSRPTLNGRPLE